MSDAANEPPAYPSAYPFSEFDPPSDLPDDLKAVYARAADPILIAHSFCSFPERFDFSTEKLNSWHDPLKRACNELAGWIGRKEAELRADAPKVLLALQKILGAVEPLSVRLGAMICLLDARPADPSDTKLVALVSAIRENSRINHSQLAHESLDGISVSPGSTLPELRSALSVWAKRGQKPEYLAGAVKRGAKKRNKARNKWIVSQRKKGRTFGEIVFDLQEKCQQNEWSPVSSPQAIQDICQKNGCLTTPEIKSKIKSNRRCT